MLPRMSSSGVEIELKIPVADLGPVREHLRRSGARITHPLARELNLILDTPDRRLESAGCVLRLRRYGGRQLLTFKGPPSFDGGVKTRTEHELGVEDVGRMQLVLEGVGFAVAVRYEKDRESWRLGEASVVLDHTPMGDFVEIEGPGDRLAEAARALGLDPHTAVRGSYLELWREHRSRRRELPVDMVFPE